MAGSHVRVGVEGVSEGVFLLGLLVYGVHTLVIVSILGNGVRKTAAVVS